MKSGRKEGEDKKALHRRFATHDDPRSVAMRRYRAPSSCPAAARSPPFRAAGDSTTGTRELRDCRTSIWLPPP